MRACAYALRMTRRCAHVARRDALVSVGPRITYAVVHLPAVREGGREGGKGEEEREKENGRSVWE